MGPCVHDRVEGIKLDGPARNPLFIGVPSAVAIQVVPLVARDAPHWGWGDIYRDLSTYVGVRMQAGPGPPACSVC